MLIGCNGSPEIPGIVIQWGSDRPGGSPGLPFGNIRRGGNQRTHVAVGINLKQIGDHIFIHVRAVGNLEGRSLRIDFCIILGAANGESAGGIICRIYKEAAVGPWTIALAVSGPHAPVMPGIVAKLRRNGPGCGVARFGDALLSCNQAGHGFIRIDLKGVSDDITVRIRTVLDYKVRLKSRHFGIVCR